MLFPFGHAERRGILSGNPKKEGLCQSIIDAAKLGAVDGGAEVDEIKLCDYKLIRCQVCGDGFGPCREENYCIYGKEDGFDEIKARVQSRGYHSRNSCILVGNIRSFKELHR